MNKKLQVFVSSTYNDLKDERQAAVEAILNAGHIPAGMELFKPDNESQLKTIYRWIDESDVFMLILGGRYGSIEPKTGKSYTHLEYGYALAKNKPVFAVILSEAFLTNKINLMGLSNAIEQNAPDKYRFFKSSVMSKIIKIVDDCKDIKLIVHATLNDYARRYNLKGWIRNSGFFNMNANTFPIDSSILGESTLFYQSYSKHNKQFVKSILSIDSYSHVRLDNNVNGKSAPLPEFTYEGICSNQNEILYCFLQNNNSNEKAILQLIKSVGGLDRYIGLLSALTSSGTPVCVKVACFKNTEMISKINYSVLRKCLTSSNTSNQKSAYIIEDHIKNIFFSDRLFK